MSLISQFELIDLVNSNKGKLLGLDIGTKTIGLALSDTTLSIASPFQIIERKGWKRDLPQLSEIILKNDVYCLIAGLPLNMDGSEGPRCEFVRDFVQHILEVIDIPICFWDERLSTMAVERVLLDADMSRKRRSEVVDKLAAGYILQGTLDWLRNHR